VSGANPVSRQAGIAAGSARVFSLSISRWTRSGKVLLVLLFGLLPVALLASRGWLFEIPDRELGRGALFFHFVFVAATLQFFLLFCSILFGASAFAEEVEDQTLVYYFSRPFPRSAVFLGKVASAVLLSSAVLSLSILAAYAFRNGWPGTAGGDESPVTLPQALLCAGVASLGAAAYGSAFAAIGTFLKKPLLVSIILAFGWEVIVSNIPGVIPNVTVMYYLRSLFFGIFGPLPIPMPQGDLFTDTKVFVAPASAALTLGGVAVFCAGLGAAIVSRREYVLNRAE